jgi:hypothetical protein
VSSISLPTHTNQEASTLLSDYQEGTLSAIRLGRHVSPSDHQAEDDGDLPAQPLASPARLTAVQQLLHHGEVGV